MSFPLACVIAGALLVFMALAGSVLRRLPMSTAMLYLAFGVVLGPIGLGLVRIDPDENAELLERVTEVVVIISLFTAGLKLRLPVGDPRWRLPLRLASGGCALGGAGGPGGRRDPGDGGGQVGFVSAPRAPGGGGAG